VKLGLTRELPIDVLSYSGTCFSAISIEEKGRPLTEAELCGFVEDKDILICQLTDQISERVIHRAKRLKHLVTYSVGLDHLSLEALKNKSIKVSHTPGVLSEATANLAWALILNCARRIQPAERYLAEGHFKGFSPNLFLGLALEKGTLGIVGMGKIGQAVLSRARAFGMKVIYVSRGEKEVPHAQAVTFQALLRQSDIISLHCPLTPSTRHLFNQQALEQMKTNAILINTARGAVIDETALVQHLKAHPGFYVGLDVFENEPRVAPGLLELPNALCVPHLGSASRWAREQMALICIQEAMRFARGENLQYEYEL
jgi:glyoxylate reductase